MVSQRLKTSLQDRERCAVLTVISMGVYTADGGLLQVVHQASSKHGSSST